MQLAVPRQMEPRDRGDSSSVPLWSCQGPKLEYPRERVLLIPASFSVRSLRRSGPNSVGVWEISRR